jgi:hypothetical protein
MIGGWVWGWLIAVVAREIYEREREGEREREERRGRKNLAAISNRELTGRLTGLWGVA